MKILKQLGADHEVIKGILLHYLDQQEDKDWKLIRQAAAEVLVIEMNATDRPLQVICDAQEGEEQCICKAAIEALNKLPTEQLIEGYWNIKDPRLIPYIVNRLYQTSLVIDEKVTLYPPEGQRKTWPQPEQTITAGDIEDFRQLLQAAR